ncbi:flagellar hook-associated protein FlgK [Blastococcus tunisiensis]|uniref:Flagellar hook-associated protein 1 n=1 Tax=Blastococcus tunisiensis TaxID=1798228 RepID=A0A1I2KSG1_9ACTN|nr:flagellar hook-associated protein FlgK [Blastococcus sp. DSM 46838]SFF69885.1 flagellar hook-associated protein 1 FlgK [Blastococcus sp. DSM 46838]
MSTFSSLNAATTALWAQRRALDVTGQNIANVNTEGYSRQRVDLQAIGGSAVPAFYSTSPGIGAGVSADDVQRIRDAFLEGRGHTEHANGARLLVEAEALEQVQTAFREPGDTGIQSLLTEMWDGWEDVANQPDTDAARAQVIQRMETLVGGIQFSNASLEAQWDQTRDNLNVLVKDVNAAAETVAELNKAIRVATQAGLPANDLSDKRDVLIMKLADQVGATVRPGQYGTLDVVVGGMALVSGSSASRLAVAGPTDPDLITATDKPRIVTESGGYPVAASGTGGGQLSALNTIIPGYRKQLDDLANKLAGTLNTQQALGWDRYGNQGTPLLSGTTAATLSVVVTDPKAIAASSVGTVPPAAPEPSLDGGNADVMSQLRQDPLGTDADYRKMIVELGVQAAVAIRNQDIQAVISTQVDAARESVAGVNLDEEMTNMLSFQHAYSAASRMITAIDQTLDTLINRTGLVGR